MKVIYKKELKSYFHSMIAYLYLAFFTAFSGIYYSYYCLTYGVTNYAGYVLGNITILFIIAVPILTMRLMAEEKKQKTDQLLLTSPVKPASIILGKYLAVITLFIISLIIVLCFAASISLFGTVSWKTLITGFLGYFLLGASLIAIGLFVSCVTENPVIAAVISFGIVLVTNLLEPMVSNLPGRPRYTILFLFILVGFIVWFFYSRTKNVKITAGIGTVGVIAVFVVYFMKPSLYENGIASMISWFSVMDRLTDFTDGILNLKNIIYYLSFIGVFLFLGTKAVRKEDTKEGTKSAILVTIVFAVTIVLNLGVSKADLTYDVTANKMYTISEESKNILKNLNKDVTIYMLNSKTSANTLYKTILEQYERNSDHITLKYKDLDSNPTFASKYLSSGEEATTDSVIVVCGEKHRYVDSSDFLNYSVDYTTYSQTVDSINLEPVVTEAVNYVTSDVTPIIYQLTGHGETSLDTALTKNIQADNYELKDLSLVTQEDVPDDAAMVIINGPSTDLSKDDKSKLSAYVKGAGKLMVNLNSLSDDTPNLNSLLKAYGIRVQKGVVIEGSSSHFVNGYPTWIVPDYGSHDIITPLSGENMHVLAPAAQGFHILDKTDYTITELLTSTNSSYAKVDTQSDTINRSSEDPDGPFTIAAAVEKDDTSKLVVTGFYQGTYDQANELSSGGNSNFFMNSINYLTEQENKIAVRAKTVSEEYATYTTFAQKLLSTTAIFILPGFILIAGTLVVLKRRRL